MRALNNKPRKADILRLRKQGKTFKEIKKILDCSMSTISYHCGDGTEKRRVKAQLKKRKPICKKVSSFKTRCARSNFSTFRAKLKTFKRRQRGRNSSSVNNIIKNYSCKDVINKLSDSPICYLTGEKINLNKPETYNLDHIIPASKGGTNDIDNLGICLKEANQAKGELTVPQLIKLCESILKWKNNSIKTHQSVNSDL